MAKQYKNVKHVSSLFSKIKFDDVKDFSKVPSSDKVFTYTIQEGHHSNYLSDVTLMNKINSIKSNNPGVIIEIIDETGLKKKIF